jgi:hypothetical protein
MTSRTPRDPADSEHNSAVLVAAGVADVVISGITAAFGTARGLLGRSDKSALAEDGITELKARGRLAMARYSSASPAYLEVLARHVESGRGHRDR